MQEMTFVVTPDTDNIMVYSKLILANVFSASRVQTPDCIRSTGFFGNPPPCGPILVLIEGD